MIKNKKICVVVPAFNEEKQIFKVIEKMPDFVDRIVVVDDNSTDGTSDVVLNLIASDTVKTFSTEITQAGNNWTNEYEYADKVISDLEKQELSLFTNSEILNKTPSIDRIILIKNLKNTGVGGAIARGYKWAKDNAMDCTAVMAGDGQMDPAELEKICLPVVNNEADYVKGNRLLHRGAWFVIPKIRFFGNSILSIFTKIASGYWRISDTQTGYTAISLDALKSLKLHKIYKKYGMPNDMLVKLNISYCKIKEVPIRPVYSVGEKSKMNIIFVIPRISLLLVKLFFRRLWVKYLFKDFHPLFLLYHMAIVLFVIDIPYIYKVFKALLLSQNLNFEPLFAFLFLTISSFQSLLFAMWMDIQDNERLYS